MVDTPGDVTKYDMTSESEEEAKGEAGQSIVEAAWVHLSA